MDEKIFSEWKEDNAELYAKFVISRIIKRKTEVSQTKRKLLAQYLMPHFPS